MTPEEISFNEGFLYPLYLLLIGGGLSVGLIKLFNFLHEIKLRKIEMQREDSQKALEVQREKAQKRIDREREDIRLSFEIKERIIEKDSERYTWFGGKFEEVSKMYNAGKHSSIDQFEFFKHVVNELTIRNVPISNLIALYIKGNEVLDINQDLFNMMNDALGIAVSKPDSDTRRNLLNKYLKEHNLTLEDNEIEEAVKSTSNTFEPIFLISAKSGEVTRKILNAKIYFGS